MYCKNCGKEMNNNNSFCPNCGSKNELINNNDNGLNSSMNNIHEHSTQTMNNFNNWDTNNTQGKNNNKAYTKTGIPKWVIIVSCLAVIFLLYYLFKPMLYPSSNKRILGLWKPTDPMGIYYDENNIWYFDKGHVYNYLNTNKTEYVYGLYTTETGYKGLKMAGFDKDAYNRLLAQGLKDKDIITIKILPLEMVRNGKSELMSGTRYYIWVIYDNGTKANVMACSTGSQYYFVKGQ